MKHDQLTGLKDRRAELARAVDTLKAQDDHDADELQDLERLIATVDQLVRKAEQGPLSDHADKPRRTSAKPEGRVVVLGRLRQSEGNEVRVSIDTWKRRRVVDVRRFYLPEGAEEMVPTRKGVTFTAHKLDELIDALLLAKEHLSSAGKADA